MRGDKKFEYGQPVKLVYTQEDLEPEDLGFSGIVLESPLQEMKRYLEGYEFIYKGRIEELESHIVICPVTRIEPMGSELRLFMISDIYVEADERFEKLGGSWYYKL